MTSWLSRLQDDADSWLDEVPDYLVDFQERFDDEPAYGIGASLDWLGRILVGRGSEPVLPWIERLVPSLEAWVRTPEDEPFSHVEQFEAAVILGAAGCTFASDVEQILKARAEGLVMPHNTEVPFVYYNVGFIALAWGARERAWAMAGFTLDEALPSLQEPAAIGFNLQAWTAQFVSAIEAAPPWADVEPSWLTFVDAFPMMQSASMVSLNTLLFVGQALARGLPDFPDERVADFVVRTLREVDPDD